MLTKIINGNFEHLFALVSLGAVTNVDVNQFPGRQEVLYILSIINVRVWRLTPPINFRIAPYILHWAAAFPIFTLLIAFSLLILVYLVLSLVAGSFVVLLSCIKKTPRCVFFTLLLCLLRLLKFHWYNSQVWLGCGFPYIYNLCDLFMSIDVIMSLSSVRVPGIYRSANLLLLF